MQSISLEKIEETAAQRPVSRSFKSAVLGHLALALILMSGAIATIPAPAKAQGVFDMGVLTNTVSQGAIVKSERARRAHSSHRRTKSVASKPIRAAFTPSGAVRKRSIDRFIAVIRATDPQTAASLQKQFATKDIFGTMSKQLGRYGLQTNSLTDAMTAYLVTAWQAVHGDTSDPSKAKVAGVRKQIGQAFADTPAVASASSTAKQEMADALLLQTMLISATVEGAKGKPESMALVKSNVATGARAAIGFNLATLRMTDNGLEL